ncbi:MAG: OsmC family protein [Solirubrobacterales bacterium]
MSEVPVTERQDGPATRIERQAHVLWIDHGDGGRGNLRGDSRAFSALPLSLGHDELDPGESHTTPGELLAAAQAASFVVTLADLLARRGTPARELTVDAICQVQEDGYRRTVVGLRLRVAGRGTALDAAAFAESADAAVACCPISHALSAAVTINVEAHLEGTT